MNLQVSLKEDKLNTQLIQAFAVLFLKISLNDF